MRYTLRNVPEQLDRVLRAEARRQRKSLNEVVLTILQRACGLDREPPVQRDLSDITGTWRDDPEQDRLLAAQRRVDQELWQ